MIPAAFDLIEEDTNMQASESLAEQSSDED